MLVSAVWDVEIMRTVQQMKSASISNVSTHANKREPVDQMPCVRFSTRMFSVHVQRDSLVFQLPNRVVLEYHQDVQLVNAHLPTHARVVCAICNATSMLTVPRERDVLMVCVPRCVTVTRIVCREKSV